MVKEIRRDRRVNLVFQGGGVRGIAYAGVLEGMPDYVRIHAVGGTSAGAIVAALLAIGQRGPQLRQHLNPERFAGFLSEDERSRLERITIFGREVQAMWSDCQRRGKPISLWKAFQLFRKHRKHLWGDVSAIARDRGFYRSDTLRQWLDQVFGDTRFSQIGTDDLRVVAADTQARRYVVYTKDRNPSKRIAEAVHASASIPLFFRPYIDGTAPIVDGGVLSNFPAYLFAKDPYPTIGFRLRDIEAPADLSSPRGFLRALLLTMVEAHDAERGDPPHFQPFDIPIPDIPSTKFNLSAEDTERLVAAGRAVGAGVNWEGCSSIEPLVVFFDPKPYEALEQSIKEAHKLYNTYRDASLRPEQLHQNSQFTVIIEADWTVRYELVSELQVKGKRPLLIGRSRVDGLPSTHTSDAALSIVDTDYVHEEVIGDRSIPSIRIPAENASTSKAFVTFFIPPVSDGDPPRTFRTSWSVLREFEKTLGHGRPDQIAYGTQRRADTHTFELSMRVLADATLAPLQFSSETGPTLLEGRGTTLAHSNRVYRTYEGKVPEFSVHTRTEFAVKVTLKRR
jgi:NTE family protein